MLPEEKNELDKIKNQLIDRQQSTYLALWSSLLVVNSIIISSLSSNLFKNDGEMTPCTIKIILISSVLSIFCLIIAYQKVIDHYNKMHDILLGTQTKPNKRPFISWQRVAYVLIVISGLLLLFFGVKWR
jgi:hypothetical protein